MLYLYILHYIKNKYILTGFFLRFLLLIFISFQEKDISYGWIENLKIA